MIGCCRRGFEPSTNQKSQLLLTNLSDTPGSDNPIKRKEEEERALAAAGGSGEKDALLGGGGEKDADNRV
jgi:hypothetical protein